VIYKCFGHHQISLVSIDSKIYIIGMVFKNVILKCSQKQWQSVKKLTIYLPFTKTNLVNFFVIKQMFKSIFWVIKYDNTKN